MNKRYGLTVADRTISCRLEQVPKELLDGRFDKLRFSLSHGTRIVLEYLLSMTREDFEAFMQKAITGSVEWNDMRKREAENK